jgi:hypothetical protein
MSERSERIGVAGSPRSGEQLIGALPVGRLEQMHDEAVHQ